MPNYEAIYLQHRVKAILDDASAERRLKEVQTCRLQSTRIRALQKTLSRKSNKLNDTEQRTLQDWPEQGVMLLGDSEHQVCVSNALIYANPIRSWPVSKHKAALGLLRVGFLRIAKGVSIESGRDVEILVKAGS